MNPYHPCNHWHPCHSEIPEPATWFLILIGVVDFVVWQTWKEPKGGGK